MLGGERQGFGLGRSAHGDYMGRELVSLAQTSSLQQPSAKPASTLIHPALIWHRQNRLHYESPMLEPATGITAMDEI